MCVRTTIYKIDKVLLAGAQCQIVFKMFCCDWGGGVGDSLTWTGTSNCEDGIDYIQFNLVQPCAVKTLLQRQPY